MLITFTLLTCCLYFSFVAPPWMGLNFDKKLRGLGGFLDPRKLRWMFNVDHFYTFNLLHDN
jgi:hypothetical protein